MQVCSDDSHYQRGSSELDLCTFTLVHLFVNFEFNLKHLSVNYSLVLVLIWNDLSV